MGGGGLGVVVQTDLPPLQKKILKETLCMFISMYIGVCVCHVCVLVCRHACTCVYVCNLRAIRV